MFPIYFGQTVFKKPIKNSVMSEQKKIWAFFPLSIMRRKLLLRIHALYSIVTYANGTKKQKKIRFDDWSLYHQLRSRSTWLQWTQLEAFLDMGQQKT